MEMVSWCGSTGGGAGWCLYHGGYWVRAEQEATHHERLPGSRLVADPVGADRRGVRRAHQPMQFRGERSDTGNDPEFRRRRGPALRCAEPPVPGAGTRAAGELETEFGQS